MRCDNFTIDSAVFQNVIFGYMKIDKYPVIIGETALVFEFVSEGIHGSISKLVIYSETHLHNFYNLGFGDKNEATGQIDDEVITNMVTVKKYWQLLLQLFTFSWKNSPMR